MKDELQRQKYNIYMREWSRKNREVVNARNKQYQLNNPEKIKEGQHKKYLRWKKEKLPQLQKLRAKASKKYYSTEKGKLRRREYRRKNRDKINQWLKNWKLRNPLQVRIGDRNQRAKRRCAEGNFTKAEWELLVKQYGYICPKCGKKEPEIKLTADHIIPISKGGSNYIENIQPLCKPCNSSKFVQIIKFPFPNNT